MEGVPDRDDAQFWVYVFKSHLGPLVYFYAYSEEDARKEYAKWSKKSEEEYKPELIDRGSW